MKLWRALVALILAMALVPSGASAFTGTKSLDMETGNFSQFNTTQVENGNSTTGAPTATIVSAATDPTHVKQGNYSVRYDMPANGKRVENPWDYNGVGSFQEGDDIWIARWQLLEAGRWPELGWNLGHHLTMQLKSLNNASTATQMGFDDRDNRWTTGPSGSTVVIDQPVNKGVWEKWLYHVRFSSTASGQMVFYRNGAIVYTWNSANMSAGFGSYYKQGIYQNEAVNAPSRMWIDGTTIATTRAAAEFGAGFNASGPAAFVADSFTGPDATALTAHTGETGATWTAATGQSGNVKLDNANGIRETTTTGAGVYLASGTPPSANYRVGATLRPLTQGGGASTHAGVVARWSTSAYTGYSGRYSESCTCWSIAKWVAAAMTPLASSASEVLVNGNNYDLELTANGSALTLKVNGVTKVTATDSSITAAGKAGVRLANSPQGNADGIHLDDFVAAGL
jgi:hypothetical protein